MDNYVGLLNLLIVINQFQKNDCAYVRIPYTYFRYIYNIHGTKTYFINMAHTHIL